MFHCFIDNFSYAEVYKICTGWEIVNESHLPKRICEGCEKSLIGFYNFRMSSDQVEQRIQIYQDQFVQSDKKDSDPEEEYYLVESIEEETGGYDTDSHGEATVLDEIIEESVENVEGDAVEAECVFIADEESNVQCISCSDCQLASVINKAQIDQTFSIACQCKDIFRNRQSFARHYLATHKIEEASETSKHGNIYQCRVCSGDFKSWRSRAAHEASQHGVGLKFECSQCKKKFYRKDRWKEHNCNSKVCSSKQQFYRCGVCSLVFNRRESYNKHLETAHMEVLEGSSEQQLSQRTEKEKLKLSRSSTAETQSKTCNDCGKIFANETSLTKHINVLHTNQVWSCELCDAVFVHRSTKISHMSRQHGVKKPFECTVDGCDFSCFKKDRFNAHCDKHENPEKTFSCPICQQEFKSYNTMTLHRAKHSAKSLSFECSFCSKQFLSKRNFNVHQKLHTGENLFHCSVCSRGFSRKDHLQKHQERKHKENSDNQE